MQGKWTRRLGSTAFWLALLALAIVAVGLTLARYDAIDKLTGFSALPLAALVMAAALILAVVALVLHWRHRAPRAGRAWIGLVLPLLYFGTLGAIIASAGGAPPIHDVTTDLDDPPGFTTLSLREDNLVGVGTLENWKAIHAEAYGDIQPVVLDVPPAEAIARAQAVARDMGWQIAAADASAGRMEATAFASYIRFRDDVVVRARPAPGGSRVDVRSVSRVGVGDLGYNAARVREFLERLRAA